MAVFRKPPTCSYCGKIIGRAITDQQRDVPKSQRIIGDNFIRWEYVNHSCPKKRKAEKEMIKNMGKIDILKGLKNKKK